jgi:tRNA-uridine 2-sulfurtransferase
MTHTKSKKQRTKNKPKRALVCLSGGVDSSVTALLILKQGYDVTGAFMVNYDGKDARLGIECWRKDYRDAVRVAAHLGIPLVRWDFTAEYTRDVLTYMDTEYKAGRTPNPDVLCNEFVKFGAWLERAKQEGFDYIATGHYASIKEQKDGKQITVHYSLNTSKDSDKDQTYFLHRLSQEQLKHTLFPLGPYTKTQVRALAKKHKLPTAQKEESMGICFIGEVPMKDFLQSRISQKKGNVTLQDGTIVGTHDGLAYYTIGQRHMGVGTKTTTTKPTYILSKNKKTNTLVVGPEEMLFKKEIPLENIHWISGRQPELPLQCEVRLRHRQLLQKAVISEQGSGNTVAIFKEPQRAPTPGQFMVFYQKGVCLGGATIS